VIDGGVNVTAYVNGENLAQKPSLVSARRRGSFWIGGMAQPPPPISFTGQWMNFHLWPRIGGKTVQLHYSSYFFGTKTTAPSFVSQFAFANTAGWLLAGSERCRHRHSCDQVSMDSQWPAHCRSHFPHTETSACPPSTTTYVLTAKNAYWRKTERPDRADLRAGSTDYIAKCWKTGRPVFLASVGKAAGPPRSDLAGFNDGTYEGVFTLASRPQGRNRHGRPFQRLNGTGHRASVPDIEPQQSILDRALGPVGQQQRKNKIALSSLDGPHAEPATSSTWRQLSGWEFHTGGGGNYGRHHWR